MHYQAHEQQQQQIETISSVILVPDNETIVNLLLLFSARSMCHQKGSPLLFQVSEKSLHCWQLEADFSAGLELQ